MADYHHWFGIRVAVLGAALAAGSHSQTLSLTPVAEQGLASWYGGGFNGQRSASGEIYDEEQLTAAHRTLPFGTRVRVRRLDSSESIVVRINDRGPYVESRVIDLSRAAARTLGITDPGLVAVTLEVIGVSTLAAVAVAEGHAFFAVQAGTFHNAENARRTRLSMEQKYGAARIVMVHRDSEYWCVLVGRAVTQADAEALASVVRNSDKAFRSAFVVRVYPATLTAD